MEVRRPQRPYLPLALAAAGTLFALLAVADKLFGLVQRPFYLATLAYACLSTLLLVAWLRGIRLPAGRLVRVGLYTGTLLLLVLTAAYVFAWRLSSDPTPVLLSRQLARGDALLHEGDPHQAILSYRQAARRYPDAFPVLMRLGAAYYRIGDYDRAETQFERALRRAPEHLRWQALNYLGQSNWKQQRPQEAIGFYHQARREGMPQTPEELTEWHYLLAWAYFDIRDYDAAAEHYEEVARLGRKYVAASHFNAACALAQKMKRSDSAGVRQDLTVRAVEHLRRAWDSASAGKERQELRTGLLGSDGDRDPEIDPLRPTPEFRAFVAEVRADRPAPTP